MTPPSPRLRPDPATDPAAAPDDPGDRTLVLWVPVVFAVAGVGWVRGAVRRLRLRLRVGAALIDLGARIMGAGT